MRIVLASASPRRLQLLRACGLDVEVRAANVDERVRPGEPPGEMVLRLAVEKAKTVPGLELVVAADTTVVVDGQSLGKPADAAEATAMIAKLSGRAHDVLTGFCVKRVSQVRSGVVRTKVVFRALSREEIAAYVATGEPFDKAGGYGIQGLGGALVDTVQGSYPNVVGLPVREVLAAIRELSP